MLYHDNNIVICFILKRFFIIFKSLIPYNFHNPCHQCQYQTNTYTKPKEREKKTLPH